MNRFQGGLSISSSLLSSPLIDCPRSFELPSSIYCSVLVMRDRSESALALEHHQPRLLVIDLSASRCLAAGRLFFVPETRCYENGIVLSLPRSSPRRTILAGEGVVDEGTKIPLNVVEHVVGGLVFDVSAAANIKFIIKNRRRDDQITREMTSCVRKRILSNQS